MEGPILTGGNANRRGGRKHRIPLLPQLPYALYCASIIIGAGILSLPVLTAEVGLVPVALLTVVLGFLLGAIYVRIARSVHDYALTRFRVTIEGGLPRWQSINVDPRSDDTFSSTVLTEEARRKGTGLVDEMCAWLGFGRAGRRALTVGLFAYVLPACIGYVRVGGLTLTAIASLARQYKIPVTWLFSIVAVLSIASILTTRALPPFVGRSTIGALTQMVASWIGGVALLLVLPTNSWLPIMLFALGSALLIFREGDTEQRTSTEALSPLHWVGVVIAATELLFLAATAGFSVYVLAQHQALIEPPLVPSRLEPGAVSKVIGVLLFAYTGTGVFNLVRYPQLFQRVGSRTPLSTVVGLGTLIPGLAYLGWTVAVAYCVGPDALLAADRALSYPTIPLAENIARFGESGLAVVAAGLLVALLAVTGACMGFSESLADRAARMWNARKGERSTIVAPDTRERQTAQVIVLFIATVVAVALATLPSNLQFSDILSVAGFAGGGMLLLVLPLFLPTRGRRHSGRWAIASATVMSFLLVAMALIATPPHLDHDLVNTVIGGVIIAILAVFLLAFIGLLFGEPAVSTRGPDPDSHFAIED